jgi:DNA-binding beta-propeller fold protein YncE
MKLDWERPAMRNLPVLFMAALLFALTAPATTLAQPSPPPLKAVQVAEFAEGLSQPHDGALSPDGKLIYLTDMANSRMVVLEAMTLKFVGAFGKGELSYPHDAEFDKAGRLLVADTGNDRIAIFEVRGAEAKRVGELKGLSGPEGVAVAPDGRVFVTNTRSATLAVFSDGRLEQTLGGYGAGAGELANPHDVDVAADGSIYVVDSGNNRVQVFDAALKLRTNFGAALKLNAPKYLAFDGERIWLADEDNHRILLLDRSHKLLGVLGTGVRGRGANAFYKPEAVLARGAHVWVIDTYNDRIVLLRVGP